MTTLFLTRQSYDHLIGVFSLSFWDSLRGKVSRKWSLEGTRFIGIDSGLAHEMVQHLPPGYGYRITEKE